MIFLYVMLLIAIIFFELYRIKKVFVDFLFLFNAYFIFYFIFPAIIFLMAPEKESTWHFLSIIPHAIYSLSVFLAILAGWVSLCIGFQIGSHSKIVNSYELIIKSSERQQFKFILLPFFIIVISSFILYAYGYGGFFKLVLIGKDIRAGIEHAGIYQYFIYSFQGVMYSAILFYGFYKLSKNDYLRKTGKIMFFISFFAAIFYSLCTAGRGNIGSVILITFFFGLNIQNRKKSLKNIPMFLLSFYFIYLLVVYGKSAILSLGSINDGFSVFWGTFQKHHNVYVGVTDNSELIDFMISFTRNVDHTLASVYLAIYDPDIYQSPRLFFDWVRAFWEIIPGVSQPEFIVSGTPSGLNRDYFDTNGYIPLGWIAMKIINGGFFWLFFGSLFSGIIGGWLEIFLFKKWMDSPMIPAFFIFFAYFWKDNIVGPDPFMVFLPNLSFLLLLFLSIPHFTIRRRKFNNV